MFSRAALSVLLCTLLFHVICASPSPKLKRDLPHRETRSVPAPPGWTCNNNWYDTNDGCDCGCGITDPDCFKDDQVLFCQNSDLSPDIARCDLNRNVCVRRPPDDWTCIEEWYDTSDGCDCGCGAVDPDCSKDDQSLFCPNSPLNPSESICDEQTNRCLPQAWTCSPFWYDTSDGCDCGCGAVDPDCSKDDQSLFCPNSPLSPSESICDEETNRCLPQTWTCSPFWYDTSDGCDCGCGATDPDCREDGQSLFCHNSNLSPDVARCNLRRNVCVRRRGHRGSGSRNRHQPVKSATRPPTVAPRAPRQAPKNPNKPTAPPRRFPHHAPAQAPKSVRQAAKKSG